MKRLSMVAFVTTLLVQSAAFAGAVVTSTSGQVSISADSAAGSLARVRYSADTTQSLGCQVNTYNDKAPNILCQAHDKYGRVLSCTASAVSVGSTISLA